MNPAAPPASQGRFRSFADFYPFYLSEHSHPVCRRLHFFGTVLVLATLLVAALAREPAWVLAAPLAGYGCAWIGHFFFEHNRPATFSHPWYSLAGDFVLFRDMLSGRVRF
ncbi:MAG TPA: DUF962 domain-containing protein [Steroidobacteraceae bacterium]|nr:DUF962 domain-containing protein [Steroidobacteraceae bacterium]